MDINQALNLRINRKNPPSEGLLIRCQDIFEMHHTCTARILITFVFRDVARLNLLVKNIIVSLSLRSRLRDERFQPFLETLEKVQLLTSAKTSGAILRNLQLFRHFAIFHQPHLQEVATFVHDVEYILQKAFLASPGSTPCSVSWPQDAHDVFYKRWLSWSGNVLSGFDSTLGPSPGLSREDCHRDMTSSRHDSQLNR